MKSSIITLVYFCARAYGTHTWHLRIPAGGYVAAKTSNSFDCPHGVQGDVNTLIWGLDWAIGKAEKICSDVHKKPYGCHFRFDPPPGSFADVGSVSASFTYQKSWNSFVVNPTKMAVNLVLICTILVMEVYADMIRLMGQVCLALHITDATPAGQSWRSSA